MLLNDWLFNRKKAVVAAACLTFLEGGVSLAFSPGLQAWAGEKANSLLNRIQVVMQTRKVNGGVMTGMKVKSR